MSTEVLIKAEHVSKKFCKSLRRSLWYGVQDTACELNPLGHKVRATLRRGEFWALDDVSFELRRGEALGVIGPNGAGKSTLLKLLSGLLKPDAGRITVRGRAGALLELGAGFNPVLTGRENIYINAAVLGLSRRQVDEIFDQVVDFAEIGDFVDAPVQSYSSGMWVRLAFAVAAHLNPHVLLVDEVLAVGDMAFQRKCIQHMMRYLGGGGSIILVTHNMYLMQSVCSKSLLLHRGQLAFAGTAVEGVSRYFESQTMPASVGFSPSLSPQQSDSSPMSIEEIKITSLNGNQQIRSGDDVRVSVKYRAAQEIGPVFWAFGLWTADQSVCLTGGLSRLARHEYVVCGGAGSLNCRIPSFPLAPGRYMVKAIVADLKSGAPLARLGWEEPAPPLVVTASLDDNENLYTIAGAQVRIGVEWEPQPETVPNPSE